MKIRFAVVLATCVLVAQSLFAGSNVVISQVYGGGGNSGATLKNDFIELHNRTGSAVSLAGWSVQYASTTGTTWQVTSLSGSIPAFGYYLVQESQGSGGTTALPTPDAAGTIAMGAGAGKVALVNSTAALSGACPSASIIDFVGFGAGTNCFEGAGPTPTLSNTTAALRAGGGCTDFDNNAAEFTAVAPNPRNTGAATQSCPNNPPTITPPSNPTATVNQDAPPFTVSLSGLDDFSTYNWSATAVSGITSVSVTGGQGTKTVTFTVTLQAGFSGTATFNASLSDNVNTPATTQAVNIRVDAVAVNNPPAITAPANPIITVAQDSAAFTVNLSGVDDGGVYNWSSAPGTGVASVTVTAGQGTATVTYTVNVQSGFSGTATFTASLSDNVNPPANQGVNIGVTPPPDHLVISQVYGGGGNAGAPYNRDFVQLHNPTSHSIDVTGWTLEYASAAGNTWTNNQPLGGVVGPNEYYLIALATGTTGASLPAANIDGSINMSATAGKIALVNNGAPLSGVCPIGDAHIVDFVGYGTTASCAEGNLRAPAASNTTAIFRKNNGNTDSDNNEADFATAAPDPSRTTPIQELGPWIASTDPFFNGSNAPHDASITVDFSEPVDVDTSWYSISCPSGSHNDATVAHSSDFKEYVITPNTNFAFSEQCTVTIFKNAIHDQDMDDSAPNTDTLAADYVWSFSVVAAGQAAPYAPSVHLTMGNPDSGATFADPDDHLLMEKATYALSYNRSKGTPNWVSWHLTSEWYGSLARVDTFRPDPAVPPTWYRVQASDFFTTGFDRGHMCPNADRDNQFRIPINQETYLMTNMVPQAPDNNQGPWANLENYLRTLTDAGNEIYIVSGPAGIGGTGSNGGVTTTLAGGHVTVPAYTWKVALVLPLGDSDISRITGGTRTIAVVMPNTQGIRTSNPNDWQTYLTTIDDVESNYCHCNLFSIVPQAIQNAIEAGINGNNPPGAADGSMSTNEDAAKSFTLDVASPNNNALTYTIVSGPSHGTLSGTDANRTYTPAPDFNGTDSFTFKVSDGAITSNTATVTITILEVNDPPVPADDAKSVEAGSALTFAATELTANDAAGPANESSQTLTVNAVANPTHGTVSLAAGQITFTPEVPYAGVASFTYHVCDNGVTAGLLDSKCFDGNVNVTVTDTLPPSMTDLVLSTRQLWPPNHQMADINVGYSVSDYGDAAPVCTLGITSNEPVNGTGDGDMTPDWEVLDAHHIRLRAERAGNGTGRIYTIAATCSDASGNAASKTATVSVPKSQPK